MLLIDSRKFGTELTNTRGITYILVTLSILRCHLTFPLQTLTLLTITLLRTLCYLTPFVLFPITSKVGLGDKILLNFLVMIYYEFWRELSRQECINEPYPVTQWNAGITNLRRATVFNAHQSALMLNKDLSKFAMACMVIHCNYIQNKLVKDKYFKVIVVLDIPSSGATSNAPLTIKSCFIQRWSFHCTVLQVLSGRGSKHIISCMFCDFVRLYLEWKIFSFLGYELFVFFGCYDFQNTF